MARSTGGFDDLDAPSSEILALGRRPVPKVGACPYELALWTRVHSLVLLQFPVESSSLCTFAAKLANTLQSPNRIYPDRGFIPFPRDRSRLSKVSLVTHTRNVVISVRDCPRVVIFQVGASGKRAASRRKIPKTFRPSPIFRTLPVAILFSLFFSILSPANVSVSSSSCCAPFISRVSAGGALIHSSVPSRLRFPPPVHPLPLEAPFLPHGAPTPRRSSILSLRVATRLPHPSSPRPSPPGSLSFSPGVRGSGETLRGTRDVGRAKIHGDFNTFNSSIIHRAPIQGNAGDTFHHTFHPPPSAVHSSSSRGKIAGCKSRNDDDDDCSMTEGDNFAIRFCPSTNIYSGNACLSLSLSLFALFSDLGREWIPAYAS